MQRTQVRYGMVGGDLNAFIGGVHRNAINYEARAKLTAGCFNPDFSINKQTGEFYGLDQDRIYKDYEEMAEKESQREDKIDFVSIVTPNFLHYKVAKTFLEHGINVVCEKPLCFKIHEAEELTELAKTKGLFFVVTYTYSGYPMVKFARQLVKEGKLGKIININAEYPQEWLVGELGSDEEDMAKLSVWRMDPAYAGISNCVGDIGTHIENTVGYITGLKIKRVAAKIDRFDHDLDLNANILLEYDNGCSGNYWCSQVCLGNMNALKVRIYGTKGAIEWDQEKPEYLRLMIKGQPPQTLARGTAYIYGKAAELSRIPSGHPEGYYEAFANIYKTFIGALLKKINHQQLTEEDLDFPGLEEGLDGVKFVHAVIESGDHDAKWVEL